MFLCTILIFFRLFLFFLIYLIFRINSYVLHLLFQLWSALETANIYAELRGDTIKIVQLRRRKIIAAGRYRWIPFFKLNRKAVRVMQRRGGKGPIKWSGRKKKYWIRKRLFLKTKFLWIRKKTNYLFRFCFDRFRSFFGFCLTSRIFLRGNYLDFVWLCVYVQLV